MAEYTSTQKGFQQAMKEALTGKPEDSHLYADKTSTPDFYHVFNNNKLVRDKYIDSLVMWRGKISDYDPVV